MSTNGLLTVLIRFTGSNGMHPSSSLIEGEDRCLYGLTGEGGAHGMGTVFKVTTNGVLTTLASFSGADGVYPLGKVMTGRGRCALWSNLRRR